MTINRSQLDTLSFNNRLQALLLIGSMMLLLGYLAWWLGGVWLSVFTVGLLLVLVIQNPVASPSLIMRYYRARPLSYQDAPVLMDMTQEISKRAGLDHLPQLYYLPVREMIAFATGHPSRAVIALSDGLIRQLDQEQLAGVLAHEISHIRHRDLRVMALADLISHVTRTLSFTGIMLLVFFLPWQLLIGGGGVGTVPVLLLIFSPTLAALLQLALSRNREFHADVSAAQLLGSPRPLMRALAQLDQQQGYWEAMLGRSQEPSLLRTHPLTSERLQQLQSLADTEQWHSGRAHWPKHLSNDPELVKRRHGRGWWF